MTVYNELSQAERREVLENDKRVCEQQQGTTLSQFAQAEANLDLGRFGTLGSPHVTGSTANPNYPAASAPFQHDPVPDEPALGYSIDDAPIVGEAHEIEQSIRQLGETGLHSPGQPEGGAVEDPASGSASLTDAVETAAPLPNKTGDDEPPRAA